MRNDLARLLLTRETKLEDGRRTVIALGLFDGVHRAHASLIKHAKAAADESGGLMLVYTMSRHPMEVIRPEKAPRALQPVAGRVKQLFIAGASAVLVRSFNPMFASLHADAFVRLLAQRYHPTDIFVGYNYTFGASGAGTPALLDKLGGKYGYRLHVLQPETSGGAVISSTYIRNALEAGDVELANHMLGRPYELYCEAAGGGELRVADRLVIPRAGQYAVSLDEIESEMSISADGVVKFGVDLSGLSGRIRFEIRNTLSV